jgi:hypothetical protein
MIGRRIHGSASEKSRGGSNAMDYEVYLRREAFDFLRQLRGMTGSIYSNCSGSGAAIRSDVAISPSGI